MNIRSLTSVESNISCTFCECGEGVGLVVVQLALQMGVGFINALLYTRCEVDDDHHLTLMV